MLLLSAGIAALSFFDNLNAVKSIKPKAPASKKIHVMSEEDKKWLELSLLEFFAQSDADDKEARLKNQDLEASAKN